MRPKPLITVVTVTMNDLAGLRSVSHSVAEQTYGQVEHIIIDGASTDGTKDWLASYSPPIPTKFVSEPDRGIFDAMNKGAEMAAGDLLIFMNAGDSFTTDHVLESVASHWQQGNWLWGYGAMRYVDENGKVLAPAIQMPFNARKLQLGVRFAPHQGSVISRALFEELGGFDLEFDYACDQEFAMRASERSAPAVWLEFIADFLVGGVHSQTTYWHRERLYHRMRQKNHSTVLGSTAADRVFTEMMATYRTVREKTGNSVRRLRRPADV